MLEGKELEGKVGDLGEYKGDVDAQGNITFSLDLGKDYGFTNFNLKFENKTSILKFAEAIAKKTETQWDDKVIALIKSLLGIKDEVVKIES